MSPFTCLAAALETPQPWLLPHRALAERVLRAGTSHSGANQPGANQSVAATLNAARESAEMAIRFVEHAALPAGEPYESFIRRTACVPTRDNLHDLFNGLMWLAYPDTKRRLNELQSEHIATNGIGGSRGPLRDALTLFDENAAILQAPKTLVDALRTRDWTTLFVGQREAWRSTQLVVFGHALLEKLMQPRKSITAHVWVVADSSDAAIASSLEPVRLATKPFLPLPVLGVPGWSAANENPAFYADADVFRRPREI